jgi:hypothetical protein
MAMSRFEQQMNIKGPMHVAKGLTYVSSELSSFLYVIGLNTLDGSEVTRL